MKNTGVWLDKTKAIIVAISDGKETEKVIFSDIEDFHVTSNKHLGGAREIAKDRDYLEREKHQFKAYFKAITKELLDSESIFIAGPGETYKKFSKALKEHYKTLSAKVKEIQKADSMTDNQVKALVRNFFIENS
ncbi:hypothetical protein MWU59_09545 [Flavobacteriaceae bacterium F08102]|nr:hypothetical protein [Flavobacteriaceae bacterium F08102]